jgi:hypothetical protein
MIFYEEFADVMGLEIPKKIPRFDEVTIRGTNSISRQFELKFIRKHKTEKTVFLIIRSPR